MIIMNENQILQKFKKELAHNFPLTAIISRCETYLQDHQDWKELFEFYMTLKEVEHEDKN